MQKRTRRALLGLTLSLTSAHSFGLATEYSADHPINRWPYGCVPYELLKSMGTDADYRSIAEEAIANWNDNTDLTFYEYSRRMTDAPAECVNYEGKVAISIVSLGACITPSNGSHGYPYPDDTRKIELNYVGCGFIKDERDRAVNILTHELGHALGYSHEHQRSDAGSFLQLVEDNFKSAVALSEYKPEEQISNHVTSYDYLSIMHYGMLSGSKNGDWNDESTWSLLPINNPDSPVPANLASLKSTQKSIGGQDAEGTNAFYDSSIADLETSLTELSYCSGDNFDEGKCADGLQKFQLNFRLEALNRGPFDSSDFTVRVNVPSDIPLNSGVWSVEDTNGDECNLDGRDILCSFSDIEPYQVAYADMSLVFDKDHNKDFFADIDSAVATDDMPVNNASKKKLGGGGSFGVLTLIALGFISRLRSKAKNATS